MTTYTAVHSNPMRAPAKAFGTVKGVVTRWLHTLSPEQLARVTLSDILAETENKFNQSIQSFIAVMRQWLRETRTLCGSDES